MKRHTLILLILAFIASGCFSAKKTATKIDNERQHEYCPQF